MGRKKKGIKNSVFLYFRFSSCESKMSAHYSLIQIAPSPPSSFSLPSLSLPQEFIGEKERKERSKRFLPFSKVKMFGMKKLNEFISFQNGTILHSFSLCFFSHALSFPSKPNLLLILLMRRYHGYEKVTVMY